VQLTLALLHVGIQATVFMPATYCLKLEHEVVLQNHVTLSAIVTAVRAIDRQVRTGFARWQHPEMAHVPGEVYRAWHHFSFYCRLKAYIVFTFRSEKSIFSESVQQSAADPDQIRYTWTGQGVTTFSESSVRLAHFMQNGGWDESRGARVFTARRVWIERTMP